VYHRLFRETPYRDANALLGRDRHLDVAIR
jgi:hypothetical protein